MLSPVSRCASRTSRLLGTKMRSRPALSGYRTWPAGVLSRLMYVASRASFPIPGRSSSGLFLDRSWTFSNGQKEPRGTEVLMLKGILPVAAILIAAVPVWPASYYTVRLDDPKAVYLTADAFGVRGDGVADDTDAIQKAVDKAVESASQGIVFVPEGRYRLSKAVTVWASVRVIGYGLTRPVFVLGDNTPGY